MKDNTLVFTDTEVDQIVDALSYRPFREVNGLLAKIVNQMNAGGSNGPDGRSSNDAGSPTPERASGPSSGAASPDGGPPAGTAGRSPEPGNVAG